MKSQLLTLLGFSLEKSNEHEGVMILLVLYHGLQKKVI